MATVKCETTQYGSHAGSYHNLEMVSYVRNVLQSFGFRLVILRSVVLPNFFKNSIKVLRIIHLMFSGLEIFETLKIY